jgi:predicted DNA-binding transcriptional regulator AlpA
MQDNKETVFDVATRDKGDRDQGRGPRRGRRWLKASLEPAGALEDPKVPTAAAWGPDGSPAGRVGQLVPSIASLVANPSGVAGVPVDRIPSLVVELASEQSALSALQGALSARLLASQLSVTVQENSGERLLTAEEVATVLGVTRRWVQRRARRLPFARRISDHAIRYSETGLKRWMSNRKLSAA